MKKALILSIVAILGMLIVVGLTAQTTPADVEQAVTTTTSDPEVAWVPNTVELYSLNPRRGAPPSARVCYDYVRQSGAISRTECRAITDAALTDTTGTASFFDILAPRTSTAQPENDHRRLVNRVSLWTRNNGGPPGTEVTATAGPRPRRTPRR